MSWVRIPLGTRKQEVERLPVFLYSGMRTQVRNRRSRLSDSEGIPLGTRKQEVERLPVFFVQWDEMSVYNYIYFFSP